MRDIGSKSVSGPEAVLIAAIAWWLDGFDIRRLVSHALEVADPSEMWSRRPEDLAAALSHRIPWDRVNAHFWRSAQSVPAVRHMVETAVRAIQSGDRVHRARSLVASLVLREAGEIVMSTGFLEENSEAIRAARRARRRK